MVVECLQVLGPKASTHLACKVVLVVVGVVVDVADKVEAVIEVEDVVDENVVDSVVDVVVEGASGANIRKKTGLFDLLSASMSSRRVCFRDHRLMGPAIVQEYVPQEVYHVRPADFG